jgi:hypothetical protein
MRFESEHFFEMSVRLKKWVSNERKPKEQSKSKLLTNR